MYSILAPVPAAGRAERGAHRPRPTTGGARDVRLRRFAASLERDGDRARRRRALPRVGDFVQGQAGDRPAVHGGDPVRRTHARTRPRARRASALRPPRSRRTRTPSPRRAPVMLALIVLSVSSAYFSGSRNRVNGSSSFASIARIASYVSSVESIGVRFTVSSRYLNRKVEPLVHVRLVHRAPRLEEQQVVGADARRRGRGETAHARRHSSSSRRRRRAAPRALEHRHRKVRVVGVGQTDGALERLGVAVGPEAFPRGSRGKRRRDPRADLRPRARIPAGSATGAEAARRIAARRRVRVGCGGSSFPRPRGAEWHSPRALIGIRGRDRLSRTAGKGALPNRLYEQELPLVPQIWALEASRGRSPRAARAGRLGPAARFAPPARAGGSCAGPRAWSAS